MLGTSMIDYFEMVHVDGQVKHRNVELEELRLKPKIYLRSKELRLISSTHCKVLFHRLFHLYSTEPLLVVKL